MTQHIVPQAETFNLLGEQNSDLKRKEQSLVNPVTHIKSRVAFTLMTDDINLPVHNVPLELVNQLKYDNSINIFRYY